MKNREFLLLAKPYDPARHNISGWWASEKLDGMRAFWDGGVSRGTPSVEVPWANIEKSAPISTGLWSRYGNVIHAPTWWLDALPPCPLDGELYIGPGCFQQTISICRTLTPDDRWKQIKYRVFDSPGTWQFACSGRINNPNFKKMIDDERIVSWLHSKGHVVIPPRPLESVIQAFKEGGNDVVQPVEQVKLPKDPTAKLDELFDEVIRHGGEGLMVREPKSVWLPYRSNFLLKVKGMIDAEATVIGYIAGQGKHKGRLGALHCKYNEKEFDLSGFTDTERSMQSSNDHSAIAWLMANPGAIVPQWIYSSIFPIGSQVTFRYRELTDSGIPKEARYSRVSHRT